MIDILNSYLIQHKSINVPGLGTIFLERVPARTDFVNKEIHPSHLVFRFDKYFDTPDKEFFSYLASKRHIPDYEAINLYNEFAQELRTTINTGERAEWLNIGVFTRDASGEVVFEQVGHAWQATEPVMAERIIRTNSAHSVLVGDKEKTSIEMTEFLKEEDEVVVVTKRAGWKLYALILSAVALVILLVHFYRKGFKWGSIANQHPIEMKVPA